MLDLQQLRAERRRCDGTFTAAIASATTSSTMSKKVAAQLDKLKGAEWDSDSETEEQTPAFTGKEDFVSLEQKKPAAKAAAGAKKGAGAKDGVAAATAGAAQPAKREKSNVIYLGRIPHGFYEDQMRGFFKQFGHVTRLRLSRNKTSGKSKHYAFLEFEEPEVAEIVANSMNGYRLFDHTLSCHLIPADAIHDRLFVGANKKFKTVPWAAIARNQHNATRTYEQTVARNKRLVKKEQQKRKALEALGIDYDFPGYAAQVPKKKQHITFTAPLSAELLRKKSKNMHKRVKLSSKRMRQHWSKIAAFLDVQSVVYFGCTCQRLYSILANDVVWQQCLDHYAQKQVNQLLSYLRPRQRLRQLVHARYLVDPTNVLQARLEAAQRKRNEDAVYEYTLFEL
ncbi:TPA: hypothetical protein N0F65_001442 [Lagenidium giganteum]|uniref:RRM domain-containing protein n=1 Tax=Lagenidium giganteum TaxID=4803 RepID=A0AAV2Z4H0_9STRA|nr:TPA: hypothetical protein N0F65_001442 [Lagenidium giganteum]